MQFSSSTNQGTRTWYLCYHSNILPVTTFVHLDDVHESSRESLRFSNFTEEQPNANSTVIERIHSQTDPFLRNKNLPEKSLGDISPSSSQKSALAPESCPAGAYTSHDVGHMSHIPRHPPSQTTFTIPSVMDKSIVTIYDHGEDLFGMIKLRDNDVCYTSGTIEWVGRKRTYPINSGFKVITAQSGDLHQSVSKRKIRKLNKTFDSEVDKLKECDCANILPTVNAIVDHLNALHEAVDLVDLRLNNLEDVLSKHEN